MSYHRYYAAYWHGLRDFEKRIVANLNCSNSTNEDDIANGVRFKFSTAAAVEGIRQLRECIAYKVVFQDLSRSLDGLYVGEASFARIEPFLHEVEQCLRDHIFNKAQIKLEHL